MKERIIIQSGEIVNAQKVVAHLEGGGSAVFLPPEGEVSAIITRSERNLSGLVDSDSSRTRDPFRPYGFGQRPGGGQAR